jgi:hypothetical protein
MHKDELIRKIKEIISSDSELKQDYDILRKNKIGHMANKIHENCSRGDKYVGDFTRYFISNSDENTKTIFSNIVNSEVKDKLKSSYIKINDFEFDRAIREIIDDLNEEE